MFGVTGSTSVALVRPGLKKMGFESDAKTMKTLFGRIDDDHDGRISHTEFDKSVGRLQELTNQRWQ